MYVADDCDWRPDMHDIALLHQQLFRFGTYCLYDRLGQELLLVKSAYTLIEIDSSCKATIVSSCEDDVTRGQGEDVHGRPGMVRLAFATGSGRGVYTGREQMSVSHNHPR